MDDWRRGKSRTLLKFLVDRRHPVSRDVLIELLWPNSDAQPANNSLRVALHALRQALGPSCLGNGVEQEYIIVASGNYHLNPEAELWVDVDEFVAHFERGVRFERYGRLSDAMRAYEDAEALYRDEYLVEDLYEDWAVARRERLKDQYLLLVTKLADYCFDQGDAVGCILRCHKILDKDPCREDAYARLMRCYARLGQRSQALHWYDICARTLRKELDVPPLDSTTSLYDQIAGRPDRAAEQAATGSKRP